MRAIPLIVDARVRLFEERLDPPTLEALKKSFTHVNPQHALKKRLGIPAWTEPPVYQTWKTEQTESGPVLTLPRGGMHRIREILEGAGYARQIQDRRASGLAVKAGFIPPSKMVLRDYQEAMLTSATKRENCLLRASTGSGKTTVAISFASRIGLYTLVIVWSANLFDQWVERIERELGMPEKDVGLIRGSMTRIKPITVAMQQTLAARGADKLPLDSFGCVICDEVQRFAAKTLFDAVDIWPAKYRVGISADESRKDKKEFLIYDLFGQVAADIKRDDLVAEGSVLEVEIRVIPTDFAAPWYRDNHDFNRLLKEMTADPGREEMLLDAARSELRQGQQVFVLSHRREHCVDLNNRLATQYRSGLLLGGPGDLETFAATKRGLESGAILAGVGTIQAIAQGLDIPRIGRIVVGTPMASNKQLFGQARGRVCRTAKAQGKKDAVLYYLWDRNVYGLRHLENLVAWNRQVTVKDGDRWVPGKEYLKTAKNPQPDDVADFDFLGENDGNP